MADVKFIGEAQISDHNQQYELTLALDKIQAGFPAPNNGEIDGKLDLNEFCISHPASSYIFQVAGESMIEAGIMPGDYLVIDRSVEPRNGDIVIAAVNGEYTVKFFERRPTPRLIPANSAYKPIIITDDMECEIEGVVVSTVRKYR